MSKNLKKNLRNKEISLESPAKLNLFLRILNKREDGYHDIASLFVKIKLCDYLSIQISDKDQFICDIPNLLISDNLVIKARDLFRKETGIVIPLAIRLTKRIPIGAGLGGGSSNAATTLLGLNQLFKSPLDQEKLRDMGSAIGSDVSFFFTKKPTFCTGRGEILNSVDLDVARPLWIAKPQNLSLSTAKVYQNCKPNEASSEDPRRILQSFLEKDPIYVNDLEPAAFRLLPQLASIKQKIQSLGFQSVTMTGSGTSFFCFGYVPRPKLEGIDFIVI